MTASRNQGRRGSAPPSPPPSPASSPPPSPGPTLAALVRELAPGTSWEQARALCRAGRVWVDGRVATDPAWRPAAGSGLEVRPAAAVGPAGAEPEKGLIVHADADLVVVRKPPGVLTVPFERGDRDTLLALTRVALRRLATRRRSGGGASGARAGAAGGGAPAAPAARAGNPTLRAVQRLDKDTSGLLVFARTVAAQRALQLQLARGEVTRRYEALVHGAAGDAVYESWLLEDRGDGLRGSWGAWPATPPAGRPAATTATAPPPGARHAVTRVRVLEALRGATRIACELETGRQHQIRIHLAEAGHPLVGEPVYVRDHRGPLIPAPRPLLHAGALGFLHPRDGRPLRFEEPPPADFAEVLGRLRRWR
jgi:23S rRNA pseudouridine1911/1915/1917 synthase